MEMPHNSESNPFAVRELPLEEDLRYSTALDFVPILNRWERFRLWYNAILVAYTLIWPAYFKPELLLDSIYWGQLFLGGLFTNFFFCLGPTIEGYGRYLGVWNLVFSRVLFLLGLLFTCFLATIFLWDRTR